MDNRFPVSKIRPVHGTQFCANRNTVLAKNGPRTQNDANAGHESLG